jgi:hypothetical protein
MNGFMKVVFSTGLAGFILTASPDATFAQEEGEGGNQGAVTQRDTGRGQGMRGRRGDRQRDPSQFRERMLQRIQEQLNVEDEEWGAIKPLVEDVLEKQAATRTSRFGRRGGRSGRRGAESGGRFGVSEPEAEALQKALDSETTPADEIKSKLDALRAARKEKEEALKAARDKLRAVLTARQEATLVLSGILD